MSLTKKLKTAGKISMILLPFVVYGCKKDQNQQGHNMPKPAYYAEKVTTKQNLNISQEISQVFERYQNALSEKKFNEFLSIFSERRKEKWAKYPETYDQLIENDIKISFSEIEIKSLEKDKSIVKVKEKKYYTESLGGKISDEFEYKKGKRYCLERVLDYELKNESGWKIDIEGKTYSAAIKDKNGKKVLYQLQIN